MSYTLIAGETNYIKLAEPTRSSKKIIQTFSGRGYAHHDAFVVVAGVGDLIICSNRQSCVQVTLRDPFDNIITLTMSKSAINVLFTVDPTRKSARVRGVLAENELHAKLLTGEQFPGKIELECLVGQICDVIKSPGEKKRPLVVTEQFVRITKKVVADFNVNGCPISLKEGDQARLISNGAKKILDPNNNWRIRWKLLQTLGFSPSEYDEAFGYLAVSLQDQMHFLHEHQFNLCNLAAIIGDAFGETIYLHINNSTAVVSDYRNVRPNVVVEQCMPVTGLKGNSNNPERKYVCTIDNRQAIVTVMLRIDNKIYTRPNCVQIKIEWKKCLVTQAEKIGTQNG